MMNWIKTHDIQKNYKGNVSGHKDSKYNMKLCYKNDMKN